MNKELFYKNGVLNKNMLRESWVYKNLSEYDSLKNFQYINKMTDLIFSQVIFNYMNNIKVIPLCEKCTVNNKRFIGFQIGYNNYCSKKCAKIATKHIEIETRRKNTLTKYGVEHTSKLLTTKEKQKNTNIKKYGFISPTQNSEIKKKQENTMLSKYGVKYSGESKYLLSKSLNSRFNNYKSHINDLYKDLEIINIKEGELGIKCSTCNNIYQIKTTLLRLRHFRYNVNPCLICNPLSSYKFTSQNEICKYLNDNNINYIIGDRKILNGKELDIYIAKYNIAIEFNGIYWHSDLFKEKNYHLNKSQTCEMNNIHLIHIWEDDWIYKKEIILSRLNNLLNINTRKIMGRKCDIKFIDNKICRDFINSNHLQGHINSKYNIGLFYNDALVSVMTFGKYRRSLGSKSKTNCYELYRFCSLLNKVVIGSFSKMMKFFEKNIEVDEVVTYANRDWCNKNNVYQKNGFEFISYTKPNYWYFDKYLIRKHRFQFRKDKLLKMGYDNKKNESDIMSDIGYLRVYDCGSIKYIKH